MPYCCAQRSVLSARKHGCNIALMVHCHPPKKVLLPGGSICGAIHGTRMPAWSSAGTALLHMGAPANTLIWPTVSTVKFWYRARAVLT
jgi:hypothetical protein